MVGVRPLGARVKWTPGLDHREMSVREQKRLTLVTAFFLDFGGP